MAREEKFDNNLTIKKSDEPTTVIQTKQEKIDIKEILTPEEINDTRRCYASPGDNETKNGTCVICGKSTMYAARHLCYQHYKEYLK